MKVEDCYSELGLQADCSDAELKAAWRRLAARWHPDRNDSPKALFKIQRINRALEEIRRVRQDAAPPAPAPTTAPAPGEPGARGETLRHHTARVTLEQALAGCVRELQGVVQDACAECAGAGLQPQASACSPCGGTGRVRQPLWFSWMSPGLPCDVCRGQGVTRKACGACEGSGKAPPRRYRCRVRIAPGTRDGHQLQVAARTTGRAGADKVKIKVCVRVELRPHPFLRLEPDGTVRCEVPVDGFAWMANRWTEVPTPAGLQQMKLQRGHLVYRIKGQGFPSAPSEAAADCLVTVTPLFPEAFSSEQEAQLDRLIASNSADPGTPAGQRIAAWHRMVRDWQAGPDEPG